MTRQYNTQALALQIMTQPDPIVIKGPEDLPEQFVQPFTYWDDLRGDRWAPEWDEFKLHKLDLKALPWTVVVDVLQGPLDFKYRFWGTSRARLIGAEMTEKLASDIPDEHMRLGNLAEYEQVCDLKAPLLCQTPITLATERKATFHSLRLPFGKREKVTHILSTINYDEINADHYAYYGTRPTGL